MGCSFKSYLLEENLKLGCASCNNIWGHTITFLHFSTHGHMIGDRSISEFTGMHENLVDAK